MAGAEDEKIENPKVSDNQVIEDLVPAEMPEDLTLLIVNMDKILHEGQVSAVELPAPKFPIAVLPGHTPLFTSLEKGQIVIHKKTGKETVEIEDGIAKIIQNKITVLIGFSQDNSKQGIDKG